MINDIKIEAPTQVFSCEVCKIFQSSFFYKTPPVVGFSRCKLSYLILANTDYFNVGTVLAGFMNYFGLMNY